MQKSLQIDTDLTTEEERVLIHSMVKKLAEWI